MSYWSEQVNRLFDEWIALTDQESGNPGDFIDWAVASKRLTLRPQENISSRFASKSPKLCAKQNGTTKMEDLPTELSRA